MSKQIEVDTSICDGCGQVYQDDDLAEIKDYHSRTEPGYMIPSGECPDENCGALCYPDNAHTRAVSAAQTSLDTLKNIMGLATYKKGIDHADPADMRNDLEAIKDAAALAIKTAESR